MAAVLQPFRPFDIELWATTVRIEVRSLFQKCSWLNSNIVILTSQNMIFCLLLSINGVKSNLNQFKDTLAGILKGDLHLRST